MILTDPSIRDTLQSSKSLSFEKKWGVPDWPFSRTHGEKSVHKTGFFEDGFRFWRASRKIWSKIETFCDWPSSAIALLPPLFDENWKVQCRKNNKPWSPKPKKSIKFDGFLIDFSSGGHFWAILDRILVDLDPPTDPSDPPLTGPVWPPLTASILDPRSHHDLERVCVMIDVCMMCDVWRSYDDMWLIFLCDKIFFVW